MAGLVALLAAFGLAYFVLFDSDSPPELSLKRGRRPRPPPRPVVSWPGPGPWATAPSPATASGRSWPPCPPRATPWAAPERSPVSSSLAEDGGSYQVTKAEFTVDVAQLKSDEDRRDNKIRTIGLETDTFPQATYALTSPVSIPADAADGKAVTVQSEGDLTLHGATKKVSIPLQVQRDGAQIKIVGNYEFGWADFGMTAPSVGSFVTVTGNPKLEFSLLMSKQT